MTRMPHLFQAGVASALMLAAGVARAGESPFAEQVLDYSPAPGQFVRTAGLNDPNAAIGVPDSGGSSLPGTAATVTLGGFGGSITLAFDHMVEDHPLNHYGMDAIVFGNAFYSGDFDTRWAECGSIEISLDSNGNFLADDAWYLIPGTHVLDPVGQFVSQTWDDDFGDLTFPPEFDFWIPVGRSGTWSTSGYVLPDAIFAPPVLLRTVTNPLAGTGMEGIFGYADYTPTLPLSSIPAAEYYTTPDDPFVTGISQDSGGGDAFDIAWAINPATGEPAALPGFHFVRITTAINRTPITGDMDSIWGEVSTEIDAVADAAIDPFGDSDLDEDIDLQDIAMFLLCLNNAVDPTSSCDSFDAESDRAIDLDDFSMLVPRITGPR